MDYYFISLPYSHKQQEVIEQRVKLMCQVDSFLNSKGILTISPIHKHLLFMNGSSLPNDWDFWKNLSLSLLSKSTGMILLQMEGWKDSIGVQAEIEFAKNNHIPIYPIYFNNDIYEENYLSSQIKSQSLIF